MTESPAHQPLQAFITDVLVSISRGVESANAAVTNKTFLIAPTSTGDRARDPGIDFDVALTTSAAASATGGIKVSLAGIVAGVGSELDDQTGTVHRVRFRVAIQQAIT